MPGQGSRNRANALSKLGIIQRRAAQIEPGEFAELHYRACHDKTAAGILFAGSLLVDLARRKGTPFLYFNTVAFWKAIVSRSKLKPDPAALLATRATATKMPSRQKPADVCQSLGITLRTRRSGRGFGFGETPDAAKFFVPLG